MPLYNTFLALHSLLSDNAIIQCQICNNATSASFEEFTKWNQNPNGQPEIDLHKWHWPDNANCAFTKCVILHEYCMIASKIAIFTVVTRPYLTPVCQWYYLQVQKIANLALFEGCQLCVLCIPKGNTRHNWHCIQFFQICHFHSGHKTLFKTGVSLVLPAGSRRLHIWHCFLMPFVQSARTCR